MLNQIIEQLNEIKSYFPKHQLETINQSLIAGEKTFFEPIQRLSETIKQMPEIYGQDGEGDKAIAYLHYFCANCDWYITEKDTDGRTSQAFGLVSLNNDYPELGYILIDEIVNINLKLNLIELDLYFEQKTLKQIFHEF